VTAVAVLACAVLLGAAWGWRRHCLSLVAQASHELRGPLQSALLGLHGLADPGEGGRLAAIDLELRRAALAAEDLAAAANGRRATGPADEVELGTLLAEAAAAWRLLASRHGVSLVVEPAGRPVVVRAERLRLAQAFSNLVLNAIEHGGGDVRVRVRVAAGAGARVEVTDGGAGLPCPLHELVAAARGRRGRHGHGLALAALIARRHGGRLVTVPSPRGARLVLELPLAGAPHVIRRRDGFARVVRHPPALRAGRGRLARMLRRSPGADRRRRVVPLRGGVEPPARARRAR